VRPPRSPRRPSRFRPAVARRGQRTLPASRQPRQHPVQLIPGQQPAVELKRLADLLQPSLPLRQFLPGPAQIHDAAAAEAGLGAHQAVQLRPQPQRLHRQRNLERIPAHLAAPAPVAAGLLAGDLALFAQHHRDTFAGEEKRRADADDAAADDDGVRRRWHQGVALDAVDRRGHAGFRVGGDDTERTNACLTLA